MYPLYFSSKAHQLSQYPGENQGKQGSSRGYKRNAKDGSSLEVQWLGLCAFTAGDRVQSLVRELRSHKSCDMAKKKRKKKRVGGGREKHQGDTLC